MKHYLIALIAGTFLLAGCVMGPNYQRPKIEAPAAFRGDDLKTGESSIADMRWSELFKDPVLTDLISTALSNNYDMRIAAERVSAGSGAARRGRFGSLSLTRCERHSFE